MQKLDIGTLRSLCRGSRARVDRALARRPFRGLPGQKVEAGATYFHTSERSPPRDCKTAPCPNLIAKKVNSTTRRDFERLDT